MPGNRWPGARNSVPFAAGNARRVASISAAKHPALLVLPYALDSNDSKFFHPNGFVRTQEMVEYVEDALETLLREADAGHPRLLNIGYHLRITGRPGRFPAMERVLARLAGLGDRIWVARRDAIAAAFLAAQTGR